MLELKGVNSFYGNIQALYDVNLHIDQGEIITLIGANGAGKSTTLMTVCGVVQATSGRVVYNGDDITRESPNRIVAQGICQVPEGRLIFPELTVQENLDMGAFMRSDKGAIKRDIEYCYDLFPILAERRRQEGGTLSGGEQQMLAIARAIMAKPRLLLLDEPSMGLAPLVVRQIFEIVKKVNEEHNTTIFLVEQNANLALKIGHRGYVMENGRVVLTDSCEKLLADESVKRAYLGL
ncbi:MAG: ABC transporter ATP-binding protein [Desulfovibrionaceae bacterium]|nr:ABC transporter ATP-binding protein [Desulfovibrionaceae bacterium]